MVELTFQGILATPFEPQDNTGEKSVYHVSEHVFRMSPVYTPRRAAPTVRSKIIVLAYEAFSDH
jgi:hypothetical protein